MGQNMGRVSAAVRPLTMTGVIFHFNPRTTNNARNKNNKRRAPVTLDRTANNCVIFTCGDSLGENIVPTPYTPVNSHVYNFNIYNSGGYLLADPALGPSGLAAAGNVF